MPAPSQSSVYYIVVLGDGGVGKTALTTQFCRQQFPDIYDPTIEDSYRKQAMIDNKACTLEILDTAGQEEYITLRDQWIRDGEGFLLVYSIASRRTFDHVEQARVQIERAKEDQKFSIVLVGNKADLVAEREVSKEEGKFMASRIGATFCETSAKTAINVEFAFHEVVRQIRANNGHHSGDGRKNPKECMLM
ncbi:small GTPase superfamily [Polychytrium aggregatum]|uniref:small GTPase superfamily n=1 Tax=Polychytrium aggregatum TaxID=110093 RepID=UPI0022FEFB3D|nr:small GTPase superfamily [Polychytrium aggregatum]KAI9207500.1 small GTPase superfamily [Polychytrium aggregatum]